MQTETIQNRSMMEATPIAIVIFLGRKPENPEMSKWKVGYDS